MKEGERIELHQVICTRYSTHERIIHNEENRTYHRYLMRDSHNQLYVYSGVSLGVAMGDTFNIKATVKRFETKYRCIRLARVIVTSRGIERLLI